MSGNHLKLNQLKQLVISYTAQFNIQYLITNVI